ncbi:MAG: sugar ABC transporter ATP-binding protein, partial [Oscillospiraceae bacterium]
TVGPCEIHGLVGENGAGNSTLMKILSGLYSHDEGTVEFCGKKYKKITTKLIEEIGISIIHQERQVVSFLTVAESLFLGIEPTKSFLKLMSRKEIEKKASDIIEEKVGVQINGGKLMSDLTVGEQQLVQICRALMNNPKLVIFDEPTAVLAQKEANKLFEIIRELKKTVSVIYISHYFGEILDLCDKVTVLKNGKKVSTVSTQGMTIEDLVVIMVGKDVKKQYPNKNRKLGDTVLEVKNISDDGNFKNINFDIKAGEIVGLTGLMGSGHSDIGEVLFGNKSLVDGEIVWKGESIKKMIPEKAVKKRIAYVPEDRRRRGVIPTLSVMENITLPSLEKVSIKGFIKHAQEKAETTELSEKLSIKTPNVEELCGLLSGGNQQKVVIAKWLQADSQLYILNQPTSGVDIGARAEIYSLIDMMAKQGSAVLLISQDIQEIVGLSNRIITIFRGEIRHEFTNVTEEITDKVIVSTMGGSI